MLLNGAASSQVQLSRPDDNEQGYKAGADSGPQQDVGMDADVPAGSEGSNHDDKGDGADHQGMVDTLDHDADSVNTDDMQTEDGAHDAPDEQHVQNAAAEHTPDRNAVSPLLIGLVIAVGAAAFFAGAYIMNVDQQQGDLITQEEFDDAMARLELKMHQERLAEKQQVQQQQQPPPRPVSISADDDPTIGDPDAPITIIEFSDFQCPFCARFSAQTLPLIYEEYIDKGLVKLVYRDFPLNTHPNAVVTALAAECADDQGAFKGMHDALFDNQREWSGAGSQDIIKTLTAYASEIGINTDEFESCIVTGTHIEDIRGDLEDGRSYGVTGTPGFYIGNDNIGYVSVQGAQPFESFKRVIDAQLDVS